ncbi:MFS transporter [Amycolatopsis rhizosphaerae]|uniref:MFS transporter n=1 Tax=Amycolatopsis rhizosphaerae TaxID=2053003 RepID=A0A558BU72_9PSEU|nr:MFS transporter [Amycolatopsis rhizosphaerae]TVT40029.1 MFS transporter [Amycolatopsis rhizosphaerae]
MRHDTTDSPSRRGFACCAFALLVLIVGTNLPSPLYAVYAHRFGFSPVVLTLVFATYAATLVPALLLAGSAADAFGYRQVLMPGLVVAVAGVVVFAYADGTGWLFLARALQGASVGMSSGALTAAVTRTEPRGRTQRASLVTSLATTGGGGLGPVLAGACATWLPAPTRTCYLIEAVALVVAAGALLALPTALGRVGTSWRVSPPQFPASGRGVFARACATSFAGWAVTAVFLSIVPSYVRSLTGNHNLLLAGVAAGLVLLVAAVTQPLATRLGARSLQRVGLVALVAGTILLLVAGSARLLALVIAAAVFAGIGQGLAFMGAVRSANQAAPAEAHAAVISTFYIATYLGVGVPVVGVGLLATVTSTATAIDVFAVIAMLGGLAVAAGHSGPDSQPRGKTTLSSERTTGH